MVVHQKKHIFNSAGRRPDTTVLSNVQEFIVSQQE